MLSTENPTISSHAELDDVVEKYTQLSGKVPVNISHWDAASIYQKRIATAIRLDIEMGQSRLNYEFSNTLPVSLLNALGAKLGGKQVLVCPSGTASNLMALVVLKHIGKQRLIIVGPCYFQIPILAQSLGLSVVHADICDAATGIAESALLFEDPMNDAIWVTNPIYCIGQYHSRADQNRLVDILSAGGCVVADECNALQGQELSHVLGHFSGFIGTYAPHKSLCVNGLKFGVLLTSIIDDANMRRLSDSWIGPLPRSVRTDIRHFLSDNFQTLKAICENSTYSSEKVIRSILENKDSQTNLLDGTGHFRVISFPQTNTCYERSERVYLEILKKTNTSYIPMSLNHASKRLGFSFRVNLLQDDTTLLRYLPNLVAAIEEIAPSSLL